MLDYSFNEFVIIYSLHLFVIIYLEEDIKLKKKNLYWIYKSKDSMGKINNLFKIFRINQTL